MKVGALGAGAVGLAGICFLALATDGFRAVTTEGARRIAVAEARPEVPPFQLQSMADEVIPLRPRDGEILLVEFVYTTCPVICQTAAVDFAQIRDSLAARGAKVRLLSVSFDPLGDDLEAMSRYGAAHGAKGKLWTVARPDSKDLTSLLDFFGVTVIPDPWLGFEHNAAIHLIDSQGRFVEIFDTDAIQEVVDAVERRS